MVFPLGDDDADRQSTPIINYVLIAINILVFVFLQGLGTNERFTYALSTIPFEIVTGRDVLVPTPISVYITPITSMFLHGGIAHIAGNMLFL
ncbi:MAG TPA: rhomboid family intramembrane serine protease, partial [Pyrinomonadaceae bacterium]